MSGTRMLHMVFLVSALTATGLLCTAADGGGKPSAKPEARDPYKDTYAKYTPPFLKLVKLPSAKQMKLSTEKSFFTYCRVPRDERANALITAAMEMEEQGRYRDALKTYQIVIDKYPDMLYRVSKHGVFVPISQYAQRRILGFPAEDLAFYRTVHDAKARDMFEQARRKLSLMGLSEIAGKMLATSYGSASIRELGNAALDSGHYLAALEHFNTIRAFFPAEESRSREVDLKIALCRRMLGDAAKIPSGEYPKDDLAPAVRKRLEELIRGARPEKRPYHSQLASAPYVGQNDYTLFPASEDPMALRKPAWEHPLPGSRHDYYVFAQPVVTEDSIIYRHKNVVYSRSILNGEYRWVNDLGGRRTWQSWGARQYPLERVLVQDGLVFTVVSKGGPSLIALDQVTGQSRWSYGPITASTAEEARMRFLAVPAGGPRAVYAAYVLDNIEGETHTDTEYGVIAFESMTGRVLWRKQICRLPPGKFTSGFAARYRNRIRSFASPPLYKQGTVYHCTNAGAVAALDARSGRVKWLMRYPYYSGVHDLTRQFGRSGGTVRHTNVHWTPHDPMLWFNQRPMLIGERLYMLPVNAGYMMCMDRRTGKVLWIRQKGLLGTEHRWGKWRHLRRNGNFTHLLGALKTGELVFAYSHMPKPVELIDGKTGRLIWHAPKVGPMPGELNAIDREKHACMSLGAPAAGLGQFSSVPMNGRHYELGARPMLSKDGKLYISQWNYVGWPIYSPTTALTVYDVVNRKVTHRRRYYGDRLLAYVHKCVRTWSPKVLKGLEALPDNAKKNKKTRGHIANLHKIVVDTVPANPHPSFVPFNRLTFKRFGVQFELRFGARAVSMVFDVPGVKTALAKRTGPEADFAKAELAFAEARYAEAATLLKNCLKTMSSENQDFRALVNQQLFRVHKRLARAGIRSGDAKKELANCLGMSRTATTLADEIETLFALAEAYARQGNAENAARCLRSVIGTYGHHPFPIAEVATLDEKKLTEAAAGIIGRYAKIGKSEWFGREFEQSAKLLRRGLPMYFSTVSPLPKPLTLRAGERAAQRLLRLLESSPDFKSAFAARAAEALNGRTEEEQYHNLWQYPGTPAAQSVVNDLIEKAGKQNDREGRKRMWRLADAARVCDLKVPETHRKRVVAPPPVATSVPIKLPQEARPIDLTGGEDINWLVLERRGRTDHLPQLAFLGGRVRKRLDNKFVLACFDLSKDEKKPKWRVDNIRLRGLGQEPGFFDAFVHEDLVLVNGLYDVLAYEHQTGELRWRFRVPFNFEIDHIQMSGDMLVLSDRNETLALYVHSDSKAGEVAWQEGELGDLYCDPYFVGDCYVTVRKNPFSVTVRYRATGRLMGRLELPDLSLHTKHPLVEGGPRGLPISHHGHKLAVTDGWYYVMVDTNRLAIDWMRRIDSNDASRHPAMRLELNGDYLAVVKEDYDVKAIYMLSSKTGNVLWRTNPKEARSPRPMYRMFMDNNRLYGIGPHPGQGFYFVARDCRTGKLLFKTEVKGYAAKPKVELLRWNYSGRAVVRVRDRQDFEVNVFDMAKGKRLYTLKKEGAGDFNRHGNVSTAIQNGRVIMLSKYKLDL